MLLNNTKFRVFVALVSLTKNIIYFGQLSCIFLNVQGHSVLIDNHFCKLYEYASFLFPYMVY